MRRAQQRVARHGTTRQAQRGRRQAKLARRITTRVVTRTAAGRTPWHNKASPARLTPSKLGTTDHNSRCDARQRDELGVAVWKRGQPDNRDDQAHPEKFLLHMYIGATVFAIYMYILPLFVYATPLADRECACVVKVAI